MQDSHAEDQRCRVCERDYWRRLKSGRVIAIFALVAGLPVAAGLLLLANGLLFDGLLLVGLGPVAAAAVRVLVVGKRNSLRKEFLDERTGRLLAADEASE